VGRDLGYLGRCLCALVPGAGGQSFPPVRAALRCRARAAPALAVRGRLPRSGKSSRLIRSLRSLPRRVRMRLGDRCQAELLPAAFCDLRGSQRPNSPRGIAAPIFLLRRAWPAPDGRGRPAPARCERAALSKSYRSSHNLSATTTNDPLADAGGRATRSTAPASECCPIQLES